MAIKNRTLEEIKASYKNKTIQSFDLTDRARIQQLFEDVQALTNYVSTSAKLLETFAAALYISETLVRDSLDPVSKLKAEASYDHIVSWLRKHGGYDTLLQNALITAVENASMAAAEGDMRARDALNGFHQTMREVMAEEEGKRRDRAAEQSAFRKGTQGR